MLFSFNTLGRNSSGYRSDQALETPQSDRTFSRTRFTPFSNHRHRHRFFEGPHWRKLECSMPKMPKKSKSPSPGWARSIRELRDELGLNQAELGLRLHYSAMAISRWERGEQEPTDRAYIELGNLAGNPKCWNFWTRAGLHSETLLRVMPEMRERLQTSTFADLEIVRAGIGPPKTH